MTTQQNTPGEITQTLLQFLEVFEAILSFNFSIKFQRHTNSYISGAASAVGARAAPWVREIKPIHVRNFG